MTSLLAPRVGTTSWPPMYKAALAADIPKNQTCSPVSIFENKRTPLEAARRLRSDHNLSIQYLSTFFFVSGHQFFAYYSSLFFFHRALGPLFPIKHCFAIKFEQELCSKSSVTMSWRNWHWQLQVTSWCVREMDLLLRKTKPLRKQHKQGDPKELCKRGKLRRQRSAQKRRNSGLLVSVRQQGALKELC